VVVVELGVQQALMAAQVGAVGAQGLLSQLMPVEQERLTKATLEAHQLTQLRIEVVVEAALEQ
jgi:hypothetical protein